MVRWESVRAVFLDADDTLYRVRGSVGEHYAPHLQKHGISAAPEEIDAVLHKSWHSLEQSYENWENDHITDHQRDREVWRGFVERVVSHFSPNRPSDQLFEAIYQAFAEAESRELSPRVTEFLDWARSQNFSTGILTNNDQRIHNLVQSLQLDRHFDHVFCASDIGYKKPSTRLFHGVAERTGYSPEELLYIGDSFELDYLGAEKAGWQSIHYASSLEIGPPRAARFIRCFGELVRDV